MAKKNFDNLESGNKNLGNGVNALFRSPEKEILKSQESEKEEKNVKVTKVTYSVLFPKEEHIYIKELVSFKTKQGFYSYSLKDAFQEGLDILKEKNPSISNDPLDKRHFKGTSEVKNKKDTRTHDYAGAYKTSTRLLEDDKNWIDNYIAFECRSNEYFFKLDFIINLVNELKLKYGKDL